MPDLFHRLIQDTLVYLKDLPKQPFLISPEEGIFFQRKHTKEPILNPKIENFSPPLAPLSLEKKMTRELKEVSQTPTHEITPLAQEAKVLPSSTEKNHSPIKKTLQQIAPHLKLLDQIPDDRQARRIASAWQEKVPNVEVILLVCNPAAETLEFLKTLAKAVDQHLAKAKILMAERLEKEKRWDLFLEKNAFRLIIASEGIQRHPELMRFYKAIPTTGQFFLGTTPFLPLTSASVYKLIEHKATLWKMLCQILKK